MYGSRVDNFRNTLLKRAFYGCGAIGPIAAENSMIQLWNPLASGKILICDNVLSSVSVASNVSVNYHNAALGAVAIQGNKYLGGAAGVGAVRIGTSAGVLGTEIGYCRPTVNLDLSSVLDSDPFMIEEGVGMIIASVELNTLFVTKFEWIEISA